MPGIQTEVLIAGGGPVGMSLALELAHHGVRSVLLERNPTTTTHPKMDLTNGRSMELFRRLGVADKLRAAGVPASEPLDVVWATSGSGSILHRFAYAAPDAAREAARVRNDGTDTLEPAMRVSQIVLEPVLKKLVDANPLVDVRFGWAYEAFEQDAEGVTATIRNGGTGETASIRALYLAGCDGGGSRVRRDAGIDLEGMHAIGEAYMVHFRSTDHQALAKFGIAYHLQTAHGTLIAQNGHDIWTLQTLAPPDSDPDELLRNFMGRSFDYEILVANPWTPHMVVANRLRNGRIFLAGDAAHQVIPTGGYGMNTGIGDAVDLGWKLAAAVKGWGGEALLESYEVERLAIARRNREAAQRHLEVRLAIINLFLEAQAEGDLEGAEASERRLELGRRIAELGNAENESWGIEHGYRYRSPVICSDGPELALDPMRAAPTTFPGSRLPSLHLADGRPLFDLLGPEFTLIATGQANIGGFEAAAAAAGVPVTVVRLDREPVLDLLERPLLLVRPDQHVAWRGVAAPDDWASILATVTGRAGEADRREKAA
ncbi:FAD-monooxygenase [Sphingobium indicum IP26]|uniref:FAD-monooxygenase n=1 Tax=Sphingobium indicum F2 TaxID=1450518 RepID=A0A8E0WP92_9SPHN|nr:MULTISPECIES: FAD-dependent monooxygenase [Sphingobium]EPR15189.1 FAD-monooxygenase [Sphingobium indicum IP26]KER34931.1 FAD-monooxygenase [Sphingobium indicum F2]